MADPLGPITAGRGRGLLSFRVGPVPVTVHLSFLLVLGFLGYNLGDPVLIAVWVVVGAASVLLHELGHAFAARVAGYEPTVELAGMGGVTQYVSQGERADSRGWGAFITGAGPGIQVVAGLAVLPFVDGFGLDARRGLVGFALSAWVVVSILWGVLNLIPILPMDGGQLFRNLVPGSPATRTRIAQVVSVVMAGIGLAWGLLANQTIAALLAGWFGFANLQALLAERGDRRPSPPTTTAGGAAAPPDAAALFQRARTAMEAGDAAAAADHAGAASHATTDRRLATVAGTASLTALLQAGRAADAYRVASDPRHGLALDEVRVGQALAGHPDAMAVWEVLSAAARADGDARTRGVAAVFAASHGQAAVARSLLSAGPVSPAVRQAVDALVG